MTDTREFNKSLDRIAKALGGEEWSPEDKPEAIYKLLDKIADKLEEKSDESGDESSSILIINETFDSTNNRLILEKSFKEIYDAHTSGVTCFVNNQGSLTSIIGINNGSPKEIVTYQMGDVEFFSFVTDDENFYPAHYFI